MLLKAKSVPPSPCVVSSQRCAVLPTFEALEHDEFYVKTMLSFQSLIEPGSRASLQYLADAVGGWRNVEDDALQWFPKTIWGGNRWE